MSILQIAAAVLVSLLWGYQFVVIKVGLAQFSPLFFLGLRFIAIALLLVPFVARSTRKQLLPILAISFFLSALNFGLFYVGLGTGAATSAAIAYQLATPFIVLLSWPLLGERPSMKVLVGVFLAFAGVVFSAGGMTSNLLPAALVGASAFAYALGNVFAKRYGPFDPLMLLAWMSIFTVPQILAASWVLEHGQFASLIAADMHGWLALLYTVLIGGIAGFGLWFWLIARSSMVSVAPFGLLMPVFATLSSAIFLGERLTLRLVGGGIVALAGVALTQFRQAKV